MAVLIEPQQLQKQGIYKIVFLYVSLRAGGAEKHLLHVLDHLDRRRYSPLVICLSEPGELAPEVEARDVPLIAFRLPRKKLWKPFGLMKVAAFLKKASVDLVHTHMYHANTYGRIAAILAGVPNRIITVHTTSPGTSTRQRVTNKILARFTNCAIAVSDAGKQAMLREGAFGADRIIVVPNGIKIDCFTQPGNATAFRRELGIADGDLVLITVARLSPEKCHNDLLAAMRTLADEFPNLRLLIVGDGALRETISSTVISYQLERHVQLLGRRQDIPALLEVADVFILPSSQEGMPLAVIEAMAAGVPVIASEVGGVPELLEGGAGILFPPGDVESLIQRTRQLIDDRQLREAMGKAGIQRAGSFYSAERMVSKMEKIYESTLR